MSEDKVTGLVICFGILSMLMLFVQGNYFDVQETKYKSESCYQEYRQGQDNTWHLSIDYCGEKE